MFGMFKKEKPKTVSVSGIVERIGTLPYSEFTNIRVLKLKEYNHVFTARMSSNENDLLVALTKESDKVSFDYIEDYKISVSSFKNENFSLK